MERFVKRGWQAGKKEESWEAVTDWMGNGFEFGDRNWFSYVTFGVELFIGTVNGFGFAAARNRFTVCPALRNGFAGCVVRLVGKGLVPSKSFCAKKGSVTIGTGSGGCIWPNGENPVACMGNVLARKGFAPVICD